MAFLALAHRTARRGGESGLAGISGAVVRFQTIFMAAAGLRVGAGRALLRTEPRATGLVRTAACTISELGSALGSRTIAA